MKAQFLQPDGAKSPVGDLVYLVRQYQALSDNIVITLFRSQIETDSPNAGMRLDKMIASASHIPLLRKILGVLLIIPVVMLIDSCIHPIILRAGDWREWVYFTVAPTIIVLNYYAWHVPEFFDTYFGIR